MISTQSNKNLIFTSIGYVYIVVWYCKI